MTLRQQYRTAEMVSNDTKMGWIVIATGKSTDLYNSKTLTATWLPLQYAKWQVVKFQLWTYITPLRWPQQWLCWCTRTVKWRLCWCTLQLSCVNFLLFQEMCIAANHVIKNVLLKTSRTLHWQKYLWCLYVPPLPQHKMFSRLYKSPIAVCLAMQAFHKEDILVFRFSHQKCLPVGLIRWLGWYLVLPFTYACIFRVCPCWDTFWPAN